MSDWKAYFPECGEAASDAVTITPRWSGEKFYDAEEAASRACEIDFDERESGERGGGERGEGVSFDIVVISPAGDETRWKGRHARSVSHHVEPAEDAEPEAFKVGATNTPAASQSPAGTCPAAGQAGGCNPAAAAK